MEDGNLLQGLNFSLYSDVQLGSLESVIFSLYYEI